MYQYNLSIEKYCIVKFGDKEQLDIEQLGNSEPFPMTNLPVYLLIFQSLYCTYSWIYS